MARTSKITTFERVIAVALASLLATLPAAAQTRSCAGRAEVIAWLEERFGERPIGVGVVGDHTIVELHASETGTWTILATSLTGQSCMVSSGHSWTPIETPHEGTTASRTDGGG
ncbi:hypothetical protein [Aquamicrobium sp. LC103]|uniref:hypothetical protein n=1 Tax=Aquamicrobium sp. LC103 TaxID=1120658 RepID=UPI00063E85E7|nr:hypothetical protein [Aquamicrobium sp. LC103]TKT75480.1 hypothetical protein XW59_020380 [Aquamicrobium sp. LC103]